jgi:predicted glycosyltransferase
LILEINKNILICPLEWGLGHAGRMIPLARRLQEMNNNIFIGSGKKQLSLFRSELQGITYINFPGFKPCYSTIVPQYLVLLLETPALLYNIIREHFGLKKIIREYKIDIVISDNRFGLWNRKIKTVYITHMPVIPFPKPFHFLEFIGICLHRSVIKKYSFCFIPDLPGELNISGRLSHGIKLPRNVRYIGILSRFAESSSSSLKSSENSHKVTVILSGPEPQRSILAEKLTHILKEKELPAVVFEGHPWRKNKVVKSGNINFYNHLPTAEMKEVIRGSESIIARAGYSTIMELISLNCTALLIPTPGQTEQEYLAGYLSARRWFSTISQRDLNAAISFPKNKTDWPEKFFEESEECLNEALKELLQE